MKCSLCLQPQHPGKGCIEVLRRALTHEKGRKEVLLQAAKGAVEAHDNTTAWGGWSPVQQQLALAIQLAEEGDGG